ncbi:gallidermin/nisin family lantibiotic [Lactobacillus helsingborgensis]|uniref:gallidermin/nisin family lantibiotic n=1 Tax=Lactobacillus helsingborgensis TaxID=1218494 RepID=UPI00164F710E|nr:gallidermin/nisin family lantibiotic [Lactobacillus helsingborgensis]MBC6356679.1 gallidermin/nisin family lantibiotic [Lactobacillus helsingborgensis]
MTDFKDFNLGLTKVNNNEQGHIQPRITSKFLCTPGCVTGTLMGCNNKTISCHIHISK